MEPDTRSEMQMAVTYSVAVLERGGEVDLRYVVWALDGSGEGWSNLPYRLLTASDRDSAVQAAIAAGMPYDVCRHDERTDERIGGTMHIEPRLR
jgi:hypothetical protein